ncbi:MAG: transcriptional regulator [Planctomycetales bacterium]|nr:transcriptional regulator [Planctomycetales bacterium]
MSVGSPQLVRQWLLIKRLCVSQTGLTVAELSAALEVTEKTIRRDLTVLKDAGLPVEEQAGVNNLKSYRITQPAKLPELSFTYDEALALYLGRRHLEPLAGTIVWEAARRAFRKIESSLGATAAKYLEKLAGSFHETRFGISDYAAHSDVIDQLMLGIEDRQVVFITYQSQRSTEPVTYDVHPYCVTRHRGTLYLIGYKPEDDAFRTWKVNRIERAEVDKMPFTRRPDFDAERFLQGSLGIYHETGEIAVTIRFAPAVARYAQEHHWHPSQQCHPQRDGSVLMEMTLAGTTELTAWLLSFGQHAQVLKPASLREHLQQELIAAAGNYQSTSEASTDSAQRRKDRSKSRSTRTTSR